MRSALLGLIFTAALSGVARAEWKPMEWDACLELVRRTTAQQPTTDILNTADFRSVRVEASDGYVILTCSRPDKRVSVIKHAN